MITLAILASCSTSNDVVSGRGIIQKRKYNDGFYISLRKNYDKKTDKVPSEKEAILSQETAEVSMTEEISSHENSCFQTNLAQTSPLSEITAPKVEPNVPQVVSPPETNDKETSLSVPTNVITEKTESYKSRRVYSPKTFYTKVSESSAAPSGDVMLILLVILCFILPPLAVFLFEDASGRFVIDLILWLIGWGVGWWLLGGLAGICTLVAIIYALLIVLSVI